ncbi:MAG: C40 family peptidase [Lentimicrobium sp.]|jgi:cell wall-associated NlpC family hydrolase|nr:C40 family peptidase [Lentimicrobium sp.]
MAGGICYLSLVAVRSEPSEKSEMVNQLLYGDMVDIEETYGDWFRIIGRHDQYMGWCSSKQIEIISQETLDILTNSNQVLISGTTASIIAQGMPPITLVQGSTLHQLSNKTFAGPSGEYHIAEGTTLVPGNNHVPDIVELAASYLKTPYLWGGRSPFGIDCSGLTQMVFKMLGIKLRRDARQQAEQGHVINLLAEAQAGDLAFFDNDEGNIVHTGILTENGQIIHASGKVRIDPIDHHGIYDKNIGKYTHKLRIIRRMLT